MLLGLLLCLLTTLPLAWKWQLGVLRVGGVVLALSTLSGLIVALLGGWAKLDPWQEVFLIWLLTMGSAAAILAHRFYRDPERTAPASENAIVSPADGVVIYVRRSKGGMLPVSTKHGHRQPLVELTKTPFRSDE